MKVSKVYFNQNCHVNNPLKFPHGTTDNQQPGHNMVNMIGPILGREAEWGWTGMIKWLTGAHRRPRDWVTDDPLATIAVHRPSQVYAVTRVNPIFIEEERRSKGRCVCSGAGGKSGSSGYESQRSSSGWSGEDASEETLDHSPKILVAAPGLSTIPEGRIDYCIPRPVWPRYEGRQRKPPVIRVDRRTHRMRRLEKKSPPSPYDVLRELSYTINLAADPKKRVPAEEILRDIGQKINQSLDALTSQNVPDKSETAISEDALRRLSVSLSRSEAVATVGRALSRSGSSASDDLEAGRLSLLKRLGRFPPVDPLYDLAQGSTSTTSSSSSGFSDLTPSPPSSASSRPFGPVFLHDNTTNVPTRVRNTMLYESLQSRGPGGYEKLRAKMKTEDKQWTVCEKEPVVGTADKQICVFPSLRSPDFTLDGHQAEVLMKRLKASKRQRFWCRFITTAVGFFFFLFSVMVVSLMLTRGKRMFGSL